MEKTITICGKDVTLSNRGDWAYIYHDQFGQDVIVSVMPVVSGILKMMGGIYSEIGDGRDVSIKEFVKVIDSVQFEEAMIYFATIQLTDLLNITWAMAKCADESLPDPRRWLRSFEDFPTVDVIGPAVFDLLTKCFASSKNLERLREMLPTIPQPK